MQDQNKTKAQLLSELSELYQRVAELDALEAERKRAEAQLNEQIDELRRWHAVTLGRETRILDLRRR